MKKLRHFYYILFVFFGIFFFTGCDTGCLDCGPGGLETAFLVNNTDILLRYEYKGIYENTDTLFEILLHPKDTLLLYHVFLPIGPKVDSIPFNALLSYNGDGYVSSIYCFDGEISIKDDKGKILFYIYKDEIDCGNNVKINIESINKNNYYWIVDSIYMDNYSCNTTSEEFE